MYTYTHTHTHTHTHTYVYVYIYIMYVYIYTHCIARQPHALGQKDFYSKYTGVFVRMRTYADVC
jgi:hypothetical protein